MDPAAAGFLFSEPPRIGRTAMGRSWGLQQLADGCFRQNQSSAITSLPLTANCECEDRVDLLDGGTRLRSHGHRRPMQIHWIGANTVTSLHLVFGELHRRLDRPLWASRTVALLAHHGSLAPVERDCSTPPAAPF
jgi:hypothetical protein